MHSFILFRCWSSLGTRWSSFLLPLSCTNCISFCYVIRVCRAWFPHMYNTCSLYIFYFWYWKKGFLFSMLACFTFRGIRSHFILHFIGLLTADPFAPPTLPSSELLHFVSHLPVLLCHVFFDLKESSTFFDIGHTIWWCILRTKS